MIGEGGATLLQAIDELGSITQAAKKLGISYKYAWDKIAEMERATGEKFLATTIGGRTGGGSILTDTAKKMLREYNRTKRYVESMLANSEEWEAVGLKLSARNRFKGVVKHVDKGSVTASVKIEIKSPITITAVITKEAAEELDLKPGDNVEAVVKATEVMIAKE
ncbi:TOBE domain-containing protein [Candidatus Bathyarchaeota archaeon]|nr:TOBE domain-containing protein [Candidatus Bathyarchaeota archaeon]